MSRRKEEEMKRQRSDVLGWKYCRVRTLMVDLQNKMRLSTEAFGKKLGIVRARLRRARLGEYFTLKTHRIWVVKLFTEGRKYFLKATLEAIRAEYNARLKKEGGDKKDFLSAFKLWKSEEKVSAPQKEELKVEKEIVIQDVERKATFREEKMAYLYYVEELSQVEIGKVFGTSGQRVGQLMKARNFPPRVKELKRKMEKKLDEMKCGHYLKIESDMPIHVSRGHRGTQTTIKVRLRSEKRRRTGGENA